MAGKLELKVELGAIDRLTRPLKAINQESRLTQKAIADLRKELRQLGGDQGAAAGEAAKLNERLEEQQAKLKAVRERARQLRAGQVATAGVAAGAAGAAMAVPIVKTINAYTDMETAMLGVAKQVEGARDDNGRLTSTYYEMREEIYKIARETPMATTEIAALTEGAARMGIQGKDNLIAFTKTAAMAATAFELPADQLAEDLGKIANLYKVPIANIQALGDTINYLDDNAQSKGADIINVLQRMGGVADKLDYTQAAALGSTFLSLGAGAEVAASASNAMVRELSVATMQSKRFQTGMQALGLSSEDIEKAMATDAMGTIQTVLNKVKELNAEDQMRVTTQLFGKEYGDDAGKLANNLEELQKQLDLARSKEGSGSMAKEADARNDTLEAQKLMAQNRLFETASRLGETLAPILTQVYMRVGNIMNAVNDWIQANPELASRIMKVAASASVLLIGLGGLLAMVSAVMAPLAMIRYGLAVLGIQGVTLGGIIAKLVMPFKLVAGAFTAWIRILMANPIGALIGVVVMAIVYLIQNFDQLKAHIQNGNWAGLGIMVIKGLLFGINTMLMGIPGMIVKVVTALVGTFKSLLGIKSPSTVFAGFGADIINGLIQGITGRLAALRETIVDAASKAAAWFKQKMDINSPSRVFHQFGVYTMQGLAQGIQSSDNEPIRAMSAMARNIMSIPLDRRPPIGAGRGPGPTAAMQGAAAGAAAAGAGGIVIHVHAAPGMDERALASLVGQEFERRTRAAAARRRSSYQDAD